MGTTPSQPISQSLLGKLARNAPVEDVLAEDDFMFHFNRSNEKIVE